MSPEDSRERVLAHVTDGLVLAKEYNLPKAVQDFIPMHQGTSLMAYFYHKACVRDGVENVDPQFYRYPGPKPQSKETSIVMLADVSEAVTHSMHDPSQEEVEAAMTKVFQNRWDDGQFNEAGLSYPELEIIKGAFVHVWRTLHHERLKYPSTTTGRMAVPPEAVPPSTASTTASTNTQSTAPTPGPTIAQPAASAQASSDGN
jgi:membrane-associated HD superfamily phosphohydrolase